MEGEYTSLDGTSQFSARKRLVPKHHKGYVNEWGALLQHQAEVQEMLEEEQKRKLHEKQVRFK